MLSHWYWQELNVMGLNWQINQTHYEKQVEEKNDYSVQ